MYVIPILSIVVMNAFMESKVLNLKIMYTLNFPNGNVQTYSTSSELFTAARLLGGEAKLIGGKNYAFVPKK